MTRKTTQYIVIIVIGLVSSLCGCRQAAVKEVLAFSADYEGHLASSLARIRVNEIDAYLERIAQDIREAAVELHAEEEAAIVAAGKKVKEPEIDSCDQFNVYLVHSVSPNAATPGDNCASLTTALFLAADHPEQIYAVLSHEMGHICEVHQINQVERRKTTEVTVAIIAGIGAGLEGYGNANNPYAQRTDWGQVMRNAMASYRPWRKEDEFEADLRGLQLYIHLGLDSSGYISLFEMFRDRWGDADSPSHPRNSERISRLESAIAEMNLPPTTRRLDQYEFKRMQERLVAELESRQKIGMLQGEEIELAKVVASGALSSQVSACGPLHLDPATLSVEFDALLSQRRRGR